MERAEPIEEYAEIGFGSALILSQAERNSISKEKGGKETINEAISFARINGAILNEGEGELLLIQTAKGAQYLLTVIGFEDAIDDLP